MTAHVHSETCRHARRRDPGAMALLVTGGFFFLAPFVNAAAGGPRIGGIVLCGMRNFFGLPCPLCGMTTSFTFAARGEFDDAVRATPFGPVLWLVALGAALYGAMLLHRGRTLELRTLPDPVQTVLTNWARWLPALIVAMWVYQYFRVNVWGLFV